MAGPSRVAVTRSAGQQAPQITTNPPTFSCMAGICERGPIGTPGVLDEAGNVEPITTWENWKLIFGAFTANAQDFPLAVKSYFDEGGKRLYTSRVVHCTTPGDVATRTSTMATLTLTTASVAASAAYVVGATAGPWALTASGQFLDIIIDANLTDQAVFTFTSALRDSTTGTFVLTNGMALNVTINGTAVVFTFTTGMFVSIAAATPAEVVAAMNSRLATVGGLRAVSSVSANKVRLETTNLGTGASINVTGGTANAILAFTTGNLAGTGNVADSAAITTAELTSIVEAAIPGCQVTADGSSFPVITSDTAGASSIVQVEGTSTATGFGFDNASHTGGAAGAVDTLRFDGKWDGTFANALSPRVSAARSGDAARVDVSLMKAGIAVENWFDASMDAADPNYIVTLINSGAGTQRASRLVTVEDLLAAYPSPDNLPAVGTFGPLTGGGDGLASIAEIDFYGDKANSTATGLRVFDVIQRIDGAAIPGRSTASTANQLINWCDITREGRTFSVHSTPVGTLAAARTYMTSTGLLKGSTEIGACYGPRIYVDNPDTAIFGAAKTVLAPNEGAILGMYSRVDALKEGGAFQHPANALGVLDSARGVERLDYEDPTDRGLAWDDLINPIRAQRGKRIYVDGSRTLKKSGAAFASVGESRGVLYVQNQITEAFDDERNAALDEGLAARLTTSSTVFLRKLTAAGCFRTRIDATAWTVDFGAGLNTADIAETSTQLGAIGLNTSPAAEFIFINVTPFRGISAAFAAQTAQQS